MTILVDLIEAPLTVVSIGVFEFNEKCHFQDLRWFFQTILKFEITVLVSLT